MLNLYDVLEGKKVENSRTKKLRELEIKYGDSLEDAIKTNEYREFFTTRLPNLLQEFLETGMIKIAKNDVTTLNYLISFLKTNNLQYFYSSYGNTFPYLIFNIDLRIESAKDMLIMPYYAELQEILRYEKSISEMQQEKIDFQNNNKEWLERKKGR